MKRPEASLAIQVLPKVEDSQVIPVVDKVIAYLNSLDCNAFVGPFETTIEGDMDTLLDAAKQCQIICIQAGAASVSCYMKFFYNPHSGTYSIDEKTAKHHL